MPGQENREERLTTPLQKALFKLLCEHGASEDGKDAEGRSFTNAPPVSATLMLDMVLRSEPSEDQLVDFLAQGDRGSWEQARPLARQILNLVKLVTRLTSA